MGGALTDAAATDLLGRLRGRLPEIETTLFARIASVADPAEVEDAGYVTGLGRAVATALELGLAASEHSSDGGQPIPMPLLEQARAAARAGIGLDVVLRRYFAGYATLAEFIAEEAERDGVRGAEESRRLSRAQAHLFDILIATVTAEYSQELDARRRSSERARAERVRRLLAGELVDDTGFSYELAASHIGAVAKGPGAVKALQELAARLDRRLLLVRPDEATVWAWLGGGAQHSAAEVSSTAASLWPADARLALGEPGVGLSGWRLTHRQALAALPVALTEKRRTVRYADVPMLASALRDDLLASSLKRLYLEPLALQNNGELLQQTLRAYFRAGRQVSATAAALGISRQTVGNRLRVVEKRIGRPLDHCASELETALRLEPLSPRQAE